MSSTRAEMIALLRRQGIRDERVLAAMARVPREEFVRPGDRELAYTDRALAIGEGQTISQPYVVARMSELLDVRSTHRVLEVGTGSGYQAAVLCGLAAGVVTVERHVALADEARVRLTKLGYGNVRVISGDASLGHTDDAPYDRIIVTAAAPAIDPTLAAQLARGGLIVAPVGDEEVQELTVHHVDGREERHGQVRFVLLRGEAGFAQ